MSTVIKANSYCPVCKGKALDDHAHDIGVDDVRRAGHSKLVYDKAKRTIVTVRDGERPRWQLVMACLLDHYLSEYEQDEPVDALAREAAEIIPDWREIVDNDEWNPTKD